MTDLEITWLCAKASGLKGYVEERLSTSLGLVRLCRPELERPKGLPQWYWPLHDDAQAMLLVKKFELELLPRYFIDEGWRVSFYYSQEEKEERVYSKNLDLNRAICECIAKMQRAKEPSVASQA